MKGAVLLAALLPAAAGHGNHVYPPSWWDAGNKVGLTPLALCLAGCQNRNWLEKVVEVECACMWYTNYTVIPDGVEPTIVGNSPLRTYMDFNLHPFYPTAPDAPIDLWTRNPWRYPGKAPIFSPCGIGGGNPTGCPPNTPGKYSPSNPGNGCAGGGYAYGRDALDVKFPDVVTTTWKAGQQVEAAWGVHANHGGGYSYRLCAADGPLDEKCFQAHALDFVGDKQWLQFGNNRTTRKLYGDLTAVQTSSGTWPSGSMWRRNPIPACKGPGSGDAAGRGGGGQHPFPNKGGAVSCSAAAWGGSVYDGKVEGPQFEPPGGYPGPYADKGIYTYGFGDDAKPGVKQPGFFPFNIVDLLQVPKDIAPGNYVLSFRYDCEQTTQVWSSCSSIRILPADSTEPDGALIPDGPTGIDLGGI